MFKLENQLKLLGKDAAEDMDIPLTLGEAREIAAAFIVMRQSLRRIVSLDEKNVPKFAKEIAQDALTRTHDA